MLRGRAKQQSPPASTPAQPPQQAASRGFGLPALLLGTVTAAAVLSLWASRFLPQDTGPDADVAAGLRPRKTPAPPESINTLSVVVPCANESEFVEKTIAAIYRATPLEELREIIVIDDASEPPISDTKTLTLDFLQEHRTTIQRYDEPQGLIRAKIHGAEAATGDVVVFLDCHVRPMEDWTKSILANLRENPKRVVVPYITALDPDTWEEISPEGGGKKMCLTWNADFIWCNEYPGPYVPIMSGGLLALSKFWWDTTGGYDEHMLAWGGENLDQSLRTWLCGGEIMVAEGSRVAHMWRDPRQPKTMLKYSIPTDSVRRNRLRAVEAWLGPWASKVRTFPEFEDFARGGPLSIGSIRAIERYRDGLKCRGFETYLERFRDLYMGTGRLPRSTFHIQEVRSGLCMELDQRPEDQGEGSQIILAPCERDSELQRFHVSNSRSGTTTCCSGLKVWDFSFCAAAYEVGGVLHADACEMGGDTPAQQLQFTKDSQIRWMPGQGVSRDGCLAPREAKTGPAEPGAFLSLSTSCTAKVHFLRRRPNQERPLFRVVVSDVCLSWSSATSYGDQLLFRPCIEGEKTQLFALSHTYEDGRFQVITQAGMCLDAKHGSGPLITWPCDPVELENPNQVFTVEEGRAFLWSHSMVADTEACLDSMSQVVLRTCHTPPASTPASASASASESGAMAGAGLPVGQHWVRHYIEDRNFELHLGDTGFCLSYMTHGDSEDLLLYSVPCSGPQPKRRRWIEDGGRLRNVAADMCVDANDHASPVLFMCYAFGDPPHMQRFVVNDSGLVYTPRTWGDNGRKRYPAKCLDSRPAPPVDVAVMPCAEVQHQGSSWRQHWPEVPLETQLFLDAGGRLDV